MNLKKLIKNLLDSTSILSATLVGFLFVQTVGLGLFFLIDAFFFEKPTFINYTLQNWWSDRGEGWLIMIPLYLIGYTIIGGIIKFLYDWFNDNFERKK